MIPLLSSLQLNPKVTPLDDNLVEVTLTLPDDLVYDFLKVLDSLTGLSTSIRSKTRLARYKESSSDLVHQESLRQRDAFYARLVYLYDYYTAEGLNRTQTIKRISSDLRKENHPWSSVDLIRSLLPAAGRPWRKQT